jgi:hypothetical protein
MKSMAGNGDNGDNGLFYTNNVRAHARARARVVNCWQETVASVATVAKPRNWPKNRSCCGGQSVATVATVAHVATTVGQEPGKDASALDRDAYRQSNALLALDLGTTTGWALRLADGMLHSGSVSFRGSRFDGGGMRFVRFRGFLDGVLANAGGIDAIHFEEVRRHVGTDAAHLYGGFLATLTAWCEERRIPYAGAPVGTIKRHIAGKGNADKATVIAAVRARGFDPADDNEADAIAILLWAIETDGGVR